MDIFNKLANKPLCIHASMRSFGDLKTKAESIADQLLDAGCTLVVPTFTYRLEQPPPAHDRPQQNGWNYLDKNDDVHKRSEHDLVFRASENELSLREMGAFPAAVLERQGRKRGNHPLNSFAAIGPCADDIISTQTPEDVYGPLEKIIELGGGVLLMGVGYTSMTLLHLAERNAGRILFRRWAKNSAGKVIACATGGCSNGFDRFEQVLSPTEMYAGESRWRLLDASETLTQATDALKRSPAFARCADKTCLRCHDGVLGGPLL
ncbi:MAG: AAC(3) family N-acetyltransferase [bacterium]|nr:aminoglycoside N(3)-acetyltransferase [Gammaproteobacteria bacterium]HIL97432.1 aminoglycoside N(3)-acetyltransferase [Pseudomonadales bacterium]